jgi:hypothetical protein
MEMKLLGTLALCLFLLSGCAKINTTESDKFLSDACGSFEKFKATSDYSERLMSIGLTSYNFRKAAFLSSDVKYEVLAEYAETPLDSLGNLRAHRQDIEDFCAGLLGNRPTD